MSYLLKASSVNIARAIYALNWFDIAPGLIYISKGLNLRIVELGIATTSFYIGLASFQLVGGAFASRIGAKKVAFIGLMILGFGGIFSGLSLNLSELVISRFVAGLGSALFFSPGLSIIRDISPPESYGLQIGIYNGSFNLGGAVGAFGWVFVDKAIGWQIGLMVGGLLALGMAIENYIVLLGTKEIKAESKGFAVKMGSIIKSKTLWLISIGTIVAMFSETITGQFIVYYSEDFLRMNSYQSGLIDFVFLLFGFVGGIIGGRILTRTERRVQVVYLVLLLSGLGFIAIPFATSFLLLFALSIVLGFVTVSGFSILYIFASRYTADRTMLPFSLSFVNFIQIAIGSISPIAFTLLTEKLGDVYGWVILGVIGLALIPLLWRMPTFKD